MDLSTNYYSCEISNYLRIPRIRIRSQRRNSAGNACRCTGSPDRTSPDNRETFYSQEPQSPALSCADRCVHTSMPSVRSTLDHPDRLSDTEQEQHVLSELSSQSHTLGSISLPSLRSDNDKRNITTSKKLTPPAVVISDFSLHSEGVERNIPNNRESSGRRHTVSSNGYIGRNHKQFSLDIDIGYNKYETKHRLMAQRSMSYLSTSTVSSIGEDRSRRGSLVDLEAEGLVMTGDGRLKRTTSSPGVLTQYPSEVGELKSWTDSVASRERRCNVGHFIQRENDDHDSLSHQCCNGDTSNQQEYLSLDADTVLRRCATNGICPDQLEQNPQSKQVSQWKKVRSVVQWTPFVQTYKKQKYPWIQLAGHQGSFRPGGDGTILKKLCGRERLCLEEIKVDCLSPHVPHLIATETDEDGKDYLRMQDLLSEFVDPCVMDCKMGLRTYMEEELAKAREKPKLRKDMYEKMVSVHPHAPTEEEHRLRAVTKPRYMVWRETISSTATLGFRIEALRRSDGFSSKDYKTTCTEQQVTSEIGSFVSGYDNVAAKYLERLKQIRTDLTRSEFFRTHELVGSSLLFVHDNTGRAGVWLIDFAKTTPLPPNIQISHASAWKPGNHEDGYLIGIDNLIAVFERLVTPSI